MLRHRNLQPVVCSQRFWEWMPARSFVPPVTLCYFGVFSDFRLLILFSWHWQHQISCLPNLMSIVSACAVCSASGAEELYGSDRALRNRGRNLSLVWHHLQHTEAEVSCRFNFFLFYAAASKPRLFHLIAKELDCLFALLKSLPSTSKSTVGGYVHVHAWEWVCVCACVCMRVWV